MDIDTSGLDHFSHFSLPVYASGGAGDRVASVARRAERILDWLGGLVRLPAPPPLFVLAPADWDRIALVPQYGLAHANRTRVVMGLRQSGLYDAILASARPHLPPPALARLHRVYGEPPDLGPFCDLVLAHEATHLADRPSWLDSGTGERSWSAVEPRLLWFTELFANVGLHGCTAEREPGSLPVLEALFEVVGGIAPDRWPLRRLDRMYEAVATPGLDGTNYAWFEFRLQILAKRLWEAAGADGLREIHALLHGPVLPDDQILAALAALDPSVAEDVRRWACDEPPAW